MTWKGSQVRVLCCPPLRVENFGGSAMSCVGVGCRRRLEYFLDMEGVTGSSPVVSTSFILVHMRTRSERPPTEREEKAATKYAAVRARGEPTQAELLRGRSRRVLSRPWFAFFFNRQTTPRFQRIGTGKRGAKTVGT